MDYAIISLRVVLNNPDAGSSRSKFRAVDYAKINIFSFGTTALFSSLDDIILPLRLLRFVPESRKDTYLGLLTLIGLRRVALTSGLVGALGITLLFFFHQYHFLLFASALMGIGFGGLISANWTQAVDLAPEAEAGKYMSLTNLATSGGSALARVNGPMIDYFNARRPGLGYSAMILTSLVYLITSTLLSWTIKKNNSHLGT